MNSPRVSSPYSTASISSSSEDRGRSPSPVVSRTSSVDVTSNALKEIIQRSQEAKDIYRIMSATSKSSTIGDAAALNLSMANKAEESLKQSPLLALSKLPSGISGLSIPPAGGLISPLLQSPFLPFGIDNSDPTSSLKIDHERLSSIRLALASKAREMFSSAALAEDKRNPFSEHLEEPKVNEDCFEAQDLRVKKRKIDFNEEEKEEELESSDTEIDVSDGVNDKPSVNCL